MHYAHSQFCILILYFIGKSNIIANIQIKWVHHQYSGSVLFPINWAYFHIKLYPQAKRQHDICAWCNCIYSGLWKLAREIWIIWILWMYNLHVSNARLKIETQFPHRYYWIPLRLNGLCDFDVISSEFHVKKTTKPKSNIAWPSNFINKQPILSCIPKLSRTDDIIRIPKLFIWLLKSKQFIALFVDNWWSSQHTMYVLDSESKLVDR